MNYTSGKIPSQQMYLHLHFSSDDLYLILKLRSPTPFFVLHFLYFLYLIDNTPQTSEDKLVLIKTSQKSKSIEEK